MNTGDGSNLKYSDGSRSSTLSGDTQQDPLYSLLHEQDITLSPADSEALLPIPRNTTITIAQHHGPNESASSEPPTSNNVGNLLHPTFSNDVKSWPNENTSSEPPTSANDAKGLDLNGNQPNISK